MKSFEELDKMSQEGLVAIIGNKNLTNRERCSALCALQRRFGKDAVDSLVPSADGAGLVCSCNPLEDGDDYRGADCD